MGELVEIDVDGYTYHMTQEDADQIRVLQERAEYLDRRQYLIKIQMNSLYGALSNAHFRFFDPRLGNSTTGTGRFILEHMAKFVGKFFDGEYAYPTPSAIYGDTDSAYFKTNAATIPEAVKAADKFALELNASMIPFMEETFLCQNRYSKHIIVAREVVADRGIFVSKKMYMLHIVDLKGKPVDKLKIMGLTLKKTTIPKQISTIIRGIFERYMKNEIDWPQFKLEVIKAREGIVSSKDMKLIGSPKTVKDMNKYGDRVNRFVKGDRIPGHVRAAAAFNKALRTFNDKENQPIVSGTKIKMYHLKVADGFTKSIALPTDIDPIPQWFVEYYWPKINIDRQLEGIFTSPIVQILDALGREMPTQNDLVADECLIF